MNLYRKQLSNFVRRSIIKNENFKHTNQLRHISTKEQHPDVVIEDNFVKRFMKTVGWIDQSRTRLKLNGFLLYETIPSSVSYTEWFEKCELPDTFTSWFRVTELHVWMLMVRCMAEDEITPLGQKKSESGCFLRNCIVEALWADVANRSKLLEGGSLSLVKKQTNELSEQFQASIVSYDEGLSCDRVMAAAVWRRFYYMSQDANIEHIENIVKFIRQQVLQLDKILMPTQQTKINNKMWLSISR